MLSGEVERRADNYDDFIRQVNEQWWQQAYLLSKLVHDLHQAGKIAGLGQCYALAPPPALGGPNPANGDAVNLAFVTGMDIRVWQSICAQSLGVGR